MGNIKLLLGYSNGKRLKEDFAITPYLAAVYVNNEDFGVVGLSINWFYIGLFIAFGKNMPKNCPTFISLTKTSRDE